MKKVSFPIALMAVGFISGCGGGSITAPQSQSSNPTPPSNPSSPPPASVSLDDTVFVGDEIVLGWPLAQTAQADLGVQQGTVEAITAAYPTTTKCEAGCTATALQTALQSGAKRLVFLMGTHDVLNSEACGGRGSWTGTAGGAGDPTGTYSQAITGARQLYGVSVTVGTIPPVFGQSATCTSAINGLNSEIKQIAEADGATVVDFNSAMQSAADFAAGGVDPNATGYAIMTSVYQQ